jgi:hypothetical protein
MAFSVELTSSILHSRPVLEYNVNYGYVIYSSTIVRYLRIIRYAVSCVTYSCTVYVFMSVLEYTTSGYMHVRQ